MTSTRARVLAGLGFLVAFGSGAVLAGSIVADDSSPAASTPAGSGDGGSASSTTAAPSTTAATTSTTTPPRTATMAFTGDLLPHSPVVSAAAANAETGWDFRPMFDDVRPVLSAADLAICHLETPVSNDDTDLGGYPVFNAPRAFVEAAIDAGYDGCSTASNHSFDRGADGVRSTLDVFEELGFSQAGIARDADSDLAPVLYEVDGISIAHISATYSLNGFALPAAEPFLVDLIEPKEIIEEAGRAKAAGADFVVVSLHWGDEYQQVPSAAQDQWLSEILPSEEVDLIIGHHAHVVQPIDKVGGEWVVFGLGNFLSNQSAGCCVVESEDGMIATVTLLENDDSSIEAVGVAYTPTWVDRAAGYVVRIANGSSARDEIADNLSVSAARTESVVSSRLGPQDGLTVAAP